MKHLASSPPNSMVLVGYRPQALPAALSFGSHVFIVCDKNPSFFMKQFSQMKLSEEERARVSILSTDFSDDEGESAQQLVTQIRSYGYQVQAVVALIEKAVLLAAHLRTLLNVGGNSVTTAEICHDKFTMKMTCLDKKIPITPFHLMTQDDVGQGEEFLAKFFQQKLKSWQTTYPVVLKERDLSGSRALKICHDEKSFLINAEKNLILEKFIYGKEISIESFVHQGEIIFFNLTEYVYPLTVNLLPLLLEKKLADDVFLLHQKVIKSFAIERGMTHMEIFLTKDGPIFGEIAIRPPGGYIMDLLNRAYGIDSWKTLIGLEMGIKKIYSAYYQEQEEQEEQEEVTLPPVPSCFAASYVIHPGEGKVVQVEGMAQIEKMENVFDSHVRLRQGKKITKRLGSGEDQGRILLRSKNYEELLHSIDQVRGLLKITMH